MAFGVDLVFEVSQLERIAVEYLRAPEVFDRHMNATLDTLGRVVLRQAQVNLTRQGAVASRQLFRSLAVRATPMARTVEATAPHAVKVEKGVRPGEAVFDRAAFRRWMQIRGIDPRWEFSIMRKIQREGLPARPFLLPALHQSRDRINREFELMALRALRELNIATRARVGA